MKYEFDVVVSGKYSGNEEALFDVADLLYEAGCKDAVIKIIYDALYIHFFRSAENLKSAIISAIRDIESVNGLKCQSVDVGDVVSLSDVSEITGINKTTLSRYSKGQRGEKGFPSPIYRVDSSRVLWSWLDIAKWLKSNGHIDKNFVEDAVVVTEINTALRIRNNKSKENVLNYLVEIER
ncbi:AlpA family transcriptional regulator [Vibrio parahaemolyticus]|uniref:helix-turn-helix transcriptional regulator n=1 Tax=Vibrio TaxID=662 RepID=UPI000472ED87|nr:hypothetical protein [Vibrio parahaemolyticus]MDF4880463.1 hypothetical protein [Vibrio parahaemolyticus]MDF5392111.1 hypothetical protein [Vibrio parahaemolyticus]MDF5398314.1 hypothetical protein [Vibrio parahaemolyticus]QRH11431.1 hypothetical protein JCT84_07875 [Vibrio parahaemolyticus]TMX38850.1 hypothetical protein DA098_12105 [Vibrio parahaemolyticus]